MAIQFYGLILRWLCYPAISVLRIRIHGHVTYATRWHMVVDINLPRVDPFLIVIVRSHLAQPRDKTRISLFIPAREERERKREIYNPFILQSRFIAGKISTPSESSFALLSLPDLRDGRVATRPSFMRRTGRGLSSTTWSIHSYCCIGIRRGKKIERMLRVIDRRANWSDWTIKFPCSAYVTINSVLPQHT